MIAWLTEALVASALLMALVLMVRGPVRRLFGPGIAYALWLLPALRLLLPPLPTAWRDAAATPLSRAGETITVLVIAGDGSGAAAAPISSSWPSPGLAAALIWVIGAAGFLLWHAGRHARFRRRLLAAATEVDRHGRVQIVESAAAAGPLAFGVWRRYVAFPRDFADRFDADERALALAHELGHHARGDLIANWAALTVLALHWFNPLAWHAFRAFRADQELANDARVLAGRPAIDRHAYACAIVKAAHGGAVSAACHLHTVSDLKGRLRMLTTSKASRRRLAAGAASVGAIVLAGLGLTASGTEAAETIRTATGIDLAQVDAPTPTVAVAPPVVPARANPPKRVSRVVVVRDGKRTDYEGSAADDYLAANPLPPVPIPPAPPVPGVAPTPPLPPIPADGVRHMRVIMRDGAGTIRSGEFGTVPRVMVVPWVESMTCPAATSSDRMVLRDSRGGQHRIIICTDRIAAAAARAADASVRAEDIRHNAMRSALTSLRATRASMLANRDLTDRARAEAAREIDAAIRELEAEAADES